MLSTILSVLKAVLPACIVSLDAAAVGELLLQVWHAVLEHADLAVVSAFAAFAFAPIFLPYHEQLRPVRLQYSSLFTACTVNWATLLRARRFSRRCWTLRLPLATHWCRT